MIPEKWRNPHHVVTSNTFSSTPNNPGPAFALHASAALLKCDRKKEKKKKMTQQLLLLTHVQVELDNLEWCDSEQETAGVHAAQTCRYIHCPFFFFF